MSWIFMLYILASRWISISTTPQFDDNELFKHTESYAFFSEKYCGIVLEFARSPQIVDKFDALIQVNQSMIPYELSIQYWDDYEYCPNFEIINKPTTIRQQMHPINLKPLNQHPYFSFIIFSRFANVSDFQAVISFRDERENNHYNITLEFQLSKSILLDTYDLVIPQTIEEGTKYYSNFTEILLNRSIAFHKNPDVCSVHISTIPRSGTHLVSRMIEEITGEWVGMLHDVNYTGLPAKDQIHYVFVPYIKIYVDHSSGASCLRSIRLVRDILECADSLYHKARTRSHHEKLKDDYYLKADYYNYIFKHLKRFSNGKRYHLNTEIAVIRYEDVMIDPIKTFQDIMTFVLGYPVQHTIYNSKIEEVMRTKGIVSSYKTLSKNEAEIKSKTDLINLVPSSLVEYIFIHYAKYNYYHDYFNKYHQYMIENNIDYDENAIKAEIKNITTNYAADKINHINKVVYNRGYVDQNSSYIAYYCFILY